MKRVAVHTYLHVREDLLELYGFRPAEERELLWNSSPSGHRPKGALAIVASGAIDKVYQAINNADSRYLQRFPGIGPKASQPSSSTSAEKSSFRKMKNRKTRTAKQREGGIEIPRFHQQKEIKAVEPMIAEHANKPVNETES